MLEGLTVSHVRHLVSLVSTPSNNLCTSVASCGDMPEVELVVTELDTVGFERSITLSPNMIREVKRRWRV